MFPTKSDDCIPNYPYFYISLFAAELVEPNIAIRGRGLIDLYRCLQTTLWIHDHVLNCLVFCITEMHRAPFCWSMFRIHFWSGFGPIWRDESCNDFIPGLSVSCFRDVNVTLTLRKQLNITAGVLSQDHT